MPDLKVMTINNDGSVNIEMPRFDDSVSGILALAQTVALMLLDPNYGNLQEQFKNRIDRSTFGEIVLKAVDFVEESLIKEQLDLEIDDSEALAGLDISGVKISKDSVDITLVIRNKSNETLTVEL